MQEYVYAPHYDFYIEKAHRQNRFDMHTFHFHKKYELYYLMEGTRRYLIDNRSYLINAGSLVLIGPDEVHKTVSVGSDPHTRIVMNFSPSAVLTSLPGIPEVDFLHCFHAGTHVVAVPMKSRGILEHTLQRICNAREDQTPSARAMRQILLCELFLSISMIIDKQRTDETLLPEPVAVNPVIDKIQVYISSNYRESLSLSELSARFYISATYLSRLFRQTTGFSIVEYINNVRLMAAKTLLEESTLKISAIAVQAGFSTGEHFTRVFKQGTGLSPQQYRKVFCGV